MLNSTRYSLSLLQTMQSMTFRAAASLSVGDTHRRTTCQEPRAAHHRSSQLSAAPTVAAAYYNSAGARRNLSVLIPARQLSVAMSSQRGSRRSANPKHRSNRNMSFIADTQRHEGEVTDFSSIAELEGPIGKQFTELMLAADSRAANNKHEEALNHFRHAADLAEAHDNSAAAFRARHGVATCYHNLGLYEDATDVWAMQFHVLNCDPSIFSGMTTIAQSQEVADTCRGACYTYLALDHPVPAIHLSNAADPYYRQKHGDSCPQVVLCYDVMGCAMWCIGGIRSNVERGARYIYTAWQLRAQHYGPDHPDTLRSLRNYAEVVTYLGNRGRAQELWEELIDRYSRVYGPAHAQTLHAILACGDCEAPSVALKKRYKKLKDLLQKADDKFLQTNDIDLPQFKERLERSIKQAESNMEERGGPWQMVKLGTLSLKAEEGIKPSTA